MGSDNLFVRRKAERQKRKENTEKQRSSNWLIVCEGKQKYAKWFAIVGVVTNILLNVILIPIMGITGAAIATAMTQIATALIAPLFFKEVREAVKDFACGLFFKFQ